LTSILVLLALVFAPFAAADPIDALDPSARPMWYAAVRAERNGNYSVARDRLDEVLLIDPHFAHAKMALGRVYAASGETERAKAAFRDLGDADALEALGLLLLQEAEYRQAAQIFERLHQGMAIEAPGRSLALHAEAISHYEPLAAAPMLRESLTYPPFVIGDEVAQRASLAIATGLQEAEEEEAERLYLLWLGSLEDWPEDAVWVAERQERFDIEDEARRLQSAAGQPLTSSQRTTLEQARTAFAAGDLTTADKTLERLLADAPRSPDAWAALAAVHLAQGEVERAHFALLSARKLEPLEVRYEAGIADLLAEHYAGQYDQQAADSYARAIRINPSWAELQMKRAPVMVRLRQLDDAEMHARRYLELAPDGPWAEAAAELIVAIGREPPMAPEIPAAEGRPSSIPQGAWDAYYLARAFKRRGAFDDALASANDALVAKPDYVSALVLKAELLLQRGARDEAFALYRQALDLRPDLPTVLLILAAEETDLAVREDLIRRAAALDHPDAQYMLAALAVDRWQPLLAKRHLAAYFEQSTEGELRPQARLLDKRIDSWLRAIAVAGVAGSGAVVLLPAGVWWRRRTGVGLRDLLERSPTAYREVARIGSAIRHEVLKHNTTVLPAVADALDDRDTAPARWAADKLFGERGAIDRFRGYVSELTLLGGVHGVRLNLRHRDPVFGPLIAGMDRLASLESAVRSGGGRGLAAELREVSDLLNNQGYQSLGGLLATVCVMPVDVDLVTRVWKSTVAEGEFRTTYEPEFSVDLRCEVPAVRVFRDELEDILANVLRNSLQATIEAEELRIGVAIDIEQDDITFLERVVIRVRDDAPRRISTAVIRSRYIERGLGLTVDLISRNGGSIHVEDEDSWSKAVVVRFPLAEVPV